MASRGKNQSAEGEEEGGANVRGAFVRWQTSRLDRLLSIKDPSDDGSVGLLARENVAEYSWCVMMKRCHTKRLLPRTRWCTLLNNKTVAIHSNNVVWRSNDFCCRPTVISRPTSLRSLHSITRVVDKSIFDANKTVMFGADEWSEYTIVDEQLM